MFQGDKRRRRTSTSTRHLFHQQGYNSVWHSRLLALICVCGYAFSERLNPPLSNDAFMLPVSSSRSPSLPPSLSCLIKRMVQYASDIKRHQSPHTVYLRCFLSSVLSRSFLVFFAHTLPVCRRCLMWSIRKQCMCVCVRLFLYTKALSLSKRKVSPQVDFPHLHRTYKQLVSFNNVIIRRLPVEGGHRNGKQRATCFFGFMLMLLSRPLWYIFIY